MTSAIYRKSRRLPNGVVVPFSARCKPASAQVFAQYALFWRGAVMQMYLSMFRRCPVPQFCPRCFYDPGGYHWLLPRLRFPAPRLLCPTRSP